MGLFLFGSSFIIKKLTIYTKQKNIIKLSKKNEKIMKILYQIYDLVTKTLSLFPY